MESGIFDKNGIEIKVGDVLIFPYITPCGQPTNDVNFKSVVVYKYGCFGIEDDIKFVPLFEWMEKAVGEYISNRGNKVIYTNRYLFWVNTVGE